MKRLDRAEMVLSVVKDALLRQVKSHRRLVCIIFAGLALLLVLVSAILSPSGQTQLRVIAYGKKTRDAEKSWTTRTAQTATWYSSRAVQDEEDDRNWAGQQKMREQRAVGSLRWDERAEQYFTSKLEKSQFPADCSKAHWIAKYDHTSGLLSDTHIYQLPLFFAMVRGHTLVPISEPKPKYPSAFEGCGPNLADINLQCFFNVTNCNPAEDSSRLSQILSKHRHRMRSSWDEALMEDDEFFPAGGVTTIQTLKQPAWDTQVCVSSSSFSSFLEAYTYHKLSLWGEMSRHGKVGVVTNSTGRMTNKCSGNEEDTKLRRVDMVIASLMSSWLLNRMSSNVKLVADKIMSRYVDTSGQPLWKSPVLAIHIRQTDKAIEDPYYREHETYRPMEDYALRMKQMEEEYGFQWPSIFLISDSGTAMESLMTILNGSDSDTLQQDKKRYIMYDWIADDHLVEKYNGHTTVPKALKHDMQTHFLATLYIVQKIADHAIVTYSSNVGRFISEIMAAKHRIAFADRAGPLVTSLDDPWWWN